MRKRFDVWRGCLTTGFCFMLGLAVPAMTAAHEIRPVGPNGEYTMVVGWFHEPAFNGESNAVDVIINRSADKKPVNTDKGDMVDLEVEVQYRAAEDGKAEILESRQLPNKPKITFGTANRYASWFKPVRAGAYGFRVRGKISDTGDPKAGLVTVDETFICGKGSKSSNDSFVCLQEPMVFPAPETKSP